MNKICFYHFYNCPALVSYKRWMWYVTLSHTCLWSQLVMQPCLFKEACGSKMRSTGNPCENWLCLLYISLCFNFLKFHYVLKFPRGKVSGEITILPIVKSTLNIYKYLFSIYSCFIYVWYHSCITNEQTEAQSNEIQWLKII